MNIWTRAKIALLVVWLILTPHSIPAETAHHSDPYEKFGIFPLNSEERQTPPDFTLPNVKGKLVSNSDFTGRPIFLNIMASGCEPCQKEMPAMEALHRQYRDRGLVVLAVFSDIMPDHAGLLESQLTGNGFTFPTLLLQGGKMNGLLSGWTPITYLIGRDGKLVGKVIGYRDWKTEEAKEIIEKLLEKERTKD
jgi:thiol-disulfide isomerase/thioredoxin